MTDHSTQLVPEPASKTRLQKLASRSERGAVLIEAAVAIPVLLLVILGALEFGVAWEAKSSTTNGLRSGLIRAASIADKPETDIRIIQSIIGEIGPDRASRIEWIVIYDASANSGDQQMTIDQCSAQTGAAPSDGGGNGGVPNVCATYGPGFIGEILTTGDADTFQMANFSLDGTCSGVADPEFCAPSRTLGGDIEVGIAFEYDHQWLTGIFPFDAPTFTETQSSSTFASEGADISGNTSFASSSGIIFGGTNGTFDSDPTNFTYTGSGNNESVTAPSGDTILGLFGPGDSALFTQPVANAYTQVCYTFDLHIIGTWEGNPTATDPIPDQFLLDVGRDGTNEFSDAFNQNSSTSVGGRTATATNQLDLRSASDSELTEPNGYDVLDNINNFDDNTFRIDECVDVVGGPGDLEILFSSTLDQGRGELWAIDNLQVAVI